MAQVWADQSNSDNLVTKDNSKDILRFEWRFITFSSETQQAAEVRWRKMGFDTLSSATNIMNAPDSIWTGFAAVGKHDLPNGFNITSIEFPSGTFSEGVWEFQVRVYNGTEWSGWSNGHKIEVSQYFGRQLFYGALTQSDSITEFPVEGNYGIKIQVMNAGGAIGESAEVQFDVWDGSTYLHHGGSIQAVPTWVNDGGTMKRTARG